MSETPPPVADELTVAVEALLAAAAPDDAALRTALADLLRVVFDRITSIAATPTAVFGPRVDTIERDLDTLARRVNALSGWDPSKESG